MKYKSDPPFDIGNPRRWVAGLQYRLAKGEKLKPFEHTVLQGQAAQQNGFEHLPMLAAALVRFSFLWSDVRKLTDSYALIRSSERWPTSRLLP